MTLIVVPDRLSELLMCSSAAKPLRIAFCSAESMARRGCGEFNFELQTARICTDRKTYAKPIQRKGTALLHEQRVTLVHELLHRYNDLHGYPQVGLNWLFETANEEAIDQAAYRLVEEAGPDGFDRFVVEATERHGVLFEYHVRHPNPFYRYHRKVLSEELARRQEAEPFGAGVASLLRLMRILPFVS